MQDPPRPTPNPGHAASPPLTHSQQSVFALMEQTLQSWGLGSLTNDLRKLIIGGDTSPDTLALALSQTKAYKIRFAGNEARIKAGLPELTPAQYIATEEQYRNILRQYGLPKGFYDDKKSTDKLIGGDVSPTEFNDRVQAAADLVYNSPPEAQRAWDQFYGGGKGGAIAAILDPKKAAPLVEKQVLAAQIGGAALAQGLHTTAHRAEEFAADGVTLQQAQKAYADIATRLQADTAAAHRFGTTFGLKDEEDATLGGDSLAMKRQATLYAEEAAQFRGHAGTGVTVGDPASNY